MAAEMFVPNTTVIETRFLALGDVFECDNGCRYRVTGAAFTLLGTTLLPVQVTERRWGRRRVYDDHVTVRRGHLVLVVGRYC